MLEGTSARPVKDLQCKLDLSARSRPQDRLINDLRARLTLFLISFSSFCFLFIQPQKINKRTFQIFI